MNKVWITGGLRSYIGLENGMYRNVSAEQLGAHVLRNVIDLYKIQEEDIELIVAGNGVGAGGNPARLMMLEAGLSERIPAMTVDVQCGSGLEAIAVAAAKIESGLIDVAIAGGMESCSTKPLRIRNERHPDYNRGENRAVHGGKPQRGFEQQSMWKQNVYHVAKFAPGKPDEFAMIRGAENTACAWNMDKQRLNQYAVASHKRAVEAAEGRELHGIMASPFSSYSANQDEGIRPGMSERLLERLPALLPDGIYITAGNACLTHDGAAFLMLCSNRYAAEHALGERAKIVDIVSVGTSPERSPESILAAVDKLLDRNHLLPEQITAWEYNEAFAVLDYLMERHFGKDCGRYNIFGGALAYGHPYGASGGIITLHLLEALKRLEVPEGMQRKDKYGIAAIAAAGGIGTAMLVKSFSD